MVIRSICLTICFNFVFSSCGDDRVRAHNRQPADEQQAEKDNAEAEANRSNLDAKNTESVPKKNEDSPEEKKDGAPSVVDGAIPVLEVDSPAQARTIGVHKIVPIWDLSVRSNETTWSAKILEINRDSLILDSFKNGDAYDSGVRLIRDYTGVDQEKLPYLSVYKFSRRTSTGLYEMFRYQRDGRNGECQLELTLSRFTTENMILHGSCL